MLRKTRFWPFRPCCASDFLVEKSKNPTVCALTCFSSRLRLLAYGSPALMAEKDRTCGFHMISHHELVACNPHVYSVYPHVCSIVVVVVINSGWSTEYVRANLVCPYLIWVSVCPIPTDFHHSPIKVAILIHTSLIFIFWHDTVDGRNPTPPWMVEILRIMGKPSINIYQLVQDFFHPQYDSE